MVANKAASRFGYARIGISTPHSDGSSKGKGYWQIGNDAVINDENPMPCADEDSTDIKYVRKIVEWIGANPDKFDASRIYAAGFSQNSMFSAYIGFCFSNIIGIFQGGSGLKYSGMFS